MSSSAFVFAMQASQLHVWCSLMAEASLPSIDNFGISMHAPQLHVWSCSNVVVTITISLIRRRSPTCPQEVGSVDTVLCSPRFGHVDTV